MSHLNSMPPYMFNLEGDFLGFAGDDLRRPAAVVIDIDQEPVAIGLPQPLRAHASLSLKPGDRLRCVGRSTINFKAGVVELEASQVFLPSALKKQPSPSPIAPSEEISAHRANPAPFRNERDQALGGEPDQQRFKVLICQKKGCQKKGGRAVAEALERFLKAHQLQNRVEIYYTGCQKRCSKAPNLTIMPGRHHYEGIQAEDLADLLKEHFSLMN